MGEVLMYEGQEYVMCWNPPMSLSPGYDSYYGLFNLKKGDPIYAWVDTLWRSIYADYNGTVNYKGVDVFKYLVQLHPQFDNIDIDPSNAQYYQYGPSGVINLTSCEGIPVFMSMPMFLGSDYAVNNTKMGLRNPIWDQDAPFLDVEPISGELLMLSIVYLFFIFYFLYVQFSCFLLNKRGNIQCQQIVATQLAIAQSSYPCSGRNQRNQRAKLGSK
ncbi:platelet glycoprotein 4 [Reticulomyxa filosa]|uniref:Platelet glycoprotein 4 n=1 Tax=Reticulomyxa filosa TaxID=46433 RepID=X6MXP5_RETFI|nr:platelet glycoprotein 4 [Reticulomyxa filosa]|eukprot:ETO18606.1 platelet glycoprotein 4 [Reticulomyxa filosa]